MCQEPESMIPIVTSRPTQVVLIGDHQQLRPIILSEQAKDLGLDISLFERYLEKAVMLTVQYRMVRWYFVFVGSH
jgi:superfamily I DNA and/or RNA helicase